MYDVLGPKLSCKKIGNDSTELRSISDLLVTTRTKDTVQDTIRNSYISRTVVPRVLK